MSVFNINELPREIFAEILVNIDGNTLGRCRRVCSMWKAYIDEADYLWHKMCNKEYNCISLIAKRKSGNDCKWYYIYRNIRMWCNLTFYNKSIKEFYKFNVYAKPHSLDVDYGLLPLRDANGIVLYDTATLKYISINLPISDCVKIANNDKVTVILLTTGILLVQRTIDSLCFTAEALFKADNFVLANDILYFYMKRNVFKCDLSNENLSAKQILRCDYDIKEIEYNNKKIYFFTKCGKFINVSNDNIVTIEPLPCPSEWLPQIKHIQLFNNRNYVCYSRTIFKIETDTCSHLYSSFPQITALLFYGEIILIGTKTGEILLYKLFKNKKASQPIFDNLAKLPDDKFALKLDICEREMGPILLVTTFLELYTIQLNFYPQEEHKIKTFTTYSKSKLDLFKRLLKIKERLKSF